MFFLTFISEIEHGSVSTGRAPSHANAERINLVLGEQKNTINRNSYISRDKVIVYCVVDISFITKYNMNRKLDVFISKLLT